MFTFNPGAPPGDIASSNFQLRAPGAATRGLPYNPANWGELCFQIAADGSIVGPFEPEATPQNAREAIDAMPPGTKFRVVQRLVPSVLDPATMAQLTDRSDAARLSTERDIYPSTWLRVDSSAPRNDLSTYTQLVNFSRPLILSRAASLKIEAVILVTPQNQPVRIDELPALQRRA